MKPDFFWNTWDEPFRAVYKALLFVFVLSISIYGFTYLSGSSFIIDWEVENLVDPVRVRFDSYHLGIFEFPINIDNYVITQAFVASELLVHEWPAYLLVIWLGIFLSIILALITDLSRFWFIASAILLTLVFLGLKLDYLILFNTYKKTALIIAFVLYFPSLYFFHFVKKEVGFAIRLLVHLCATAIFGLVIYFFSGVELPFLHLANYGIYVPLILTILFAFMAGHEIISGLLRVITSGDLTGKKNSLIHFLLISIIFLLNGALVLVRNTKIIEADIYVIGSFLLLTIASVFGIWGYRAKEITYQGLFSFYPFGAFLFLGLAITAHFTISYFFVSGNDSFAEAMEDVIIYSQLGYCSMFIIYVIANFYDLLRHNTDVGLVLYKPRRMPYFTSRFAGVIVIMALFFRFSMTPYYQAVAGFYSGVGDIYLKTGDHASALEYYKLSNIYSGTSHRANYALATMEKRDGNVDRELNYWQQAISKNPTEYAYVNLASRLLERRRYFEAIFTLQDGLQKFPDNGVLLNNLGLVYLEMDHIDSAFFYLDQARVHQKSRNGSETNVYALLSMKGLSIKPDTLTYLLRTSNHLPAINNLIVLSNDLKIRAADHAEIQFRDWSNERAEQLVYNYNKVINDPSMVDSMYLDEMNTFYDSGNTSWFQDNLNRASALALYREGDVTASFEILNQLAIQNPEKEYFPLLGKLALALNSGGLAIDYFKHAFQNGRLEIAPELAFAYMENYELEKAAFIWRQIEQNGDSSDAEMASKMIEAIETADINSLLNADIATRFSFLAYRFREFDLEELEALALSFENEDVRAMGFLRLVAAYLELGQYDRTLEVLETLGRLNISRNDVLEDINLAQCRYAYHIKDEEIMQRLHSNLESDDLRVKGYLELFEIMEKSITFGRDSTIWRFERIGFRNPFFEPGVLESVRFFNNEMEDQDKAYNILLNAVSVNPFSIELNKAYALQCLQIGLRSYAMETKEILKTMMPSVTFKTFEAEFLQALSEFESKSSIW